ncbi:hypothetical protein, conserved [Eimeria brunetti]|uniref:Uncharacterized protein n=1 Tax=Eimeria brunetti TaxID=51314 RepID=U6LBB4_9EIME|nr:hypothetical protein, conserved [Eimeria brunetti]
MWGGDKQQPQQKMLQQQQQMEEQQKQQKQQQQRGGCPARWAVLLTVLEVFPAHLSIGASVDLLTSELGGRVYLWQAAHEVFASFFCLLSCAAVSRAAAARPCLRHKLLLLLSLCSSLPGLAAVLTKSARVYLAAKVVAALLGGKPLTGSFVVLSSWIGEWTDIRQRVTWTVQSPEKLMLLSALLRLLHPLTLLLSPLRVLLSQPPLPPQQQQQQQQQQGSSPEQQQFLENFDAPTLWPADDFSVLTLRRATSFSVGSCSSSPAAAAAAAVPAAAAAPAAAVQRLRFCASLPDMNFRCIGSSGLQHAEQQQLLHSVDEDAVVVAAADAAAAAAAAEADGEAEAEADPERGRKGWLLQLQQAAAAVKKLLLALQRHVVMLWAVFMLLLQQQPLVLALTCLHCAFNAAMQGSSLAFVKYQLGFSHDQVSFIMTTFGAAGIFVQVVLLPRVLHLISTQWLLFICSACNVVYAGLFVVG